MIHKSAVILFLVLCSCATTELDQEVKPEPDDFACDRDSDCTISRVDLNDSCYPCPREPFAVSKAALSGRRSQRHPCTLEGYDCPQRTSPDGFLAVCVRHVCERRPKE
jgi:hypothetical protein